MGFLARTKMRYLKVYIMIGYIVKFSCDLIATIEGFEPGVQDGTWIVFDKICEAPGKVDKLSLRDFIRV